MTNSTQADDVAKREVPLDGGQNFRDLGGYQTHDGRQTKWGKLFRSGSMAGVTTTDHARLLNLKIQTICDLRTTEERQAEPNTWHRSQSITYWARDYESSFGALRKVMASDLPTSQSARDAMIEGYRHLPFEHAPAYKELFSRLAAQEMPLVFNCSAGKDRAGTAAALVLSALGIPRETVVEDYLLTNKFLNHQHLFRERGPHRDNIPSSLSPEIVTAIMNADADYLHAALGAVDEKHGSITAYVHEALELSEDALDKIQQSLLE